MKEIESQIIGKLKRSQRFRDWWESDLIKIPFLDNKQMKIIYADYVSEEDNFFLEEADLAISRFLEKGNQERLSITDLVYKSYRDLVDEVEFSERSRQLWEIQGEDQIWNYVYPTEIFVTRRPYNEQDMYVQILCECEWEQEHGLQIVLRQGKQVTRISNQDGHLTEADAFDKPDEEDELLCRFGETQL